MPGGSEQSFELRMKQLRAGKRVNSRVPVAIEWEEARERHSAQGWTVDISPTGCLAVVPQGFSEDGLPIGVQIVGLPWEEEVVLAVAAALEKAGGGYRAPAL